MGHHVPTDGQLGWIYISELQISGPQALHREDAEGAVHAEADLPSQVHARALFRTAGRGDGHRHLVESVLILVAFIGVSHGRKGTRAKDVVTFFSEQNTIHFLSINHNHITHLI